jgi:hypothetical protein
MFSDLKITSNSSSNIDILYKSHTNLDTKNTKEGNVLKIMYFLTANVHLVLFGSHWGEGGGEES